MLKEVSWREEAKRGGVVGRKKKSWRRGQNLEVESCKNEGRVAEETAVDGKGIKGAPRGREEGLVGKTKVIKRKRGSSHESRAGKGQTEINVVGPNPKRKRTTIGSGQSWSLT